MAVITAEKRFEQFNDRLCEILGYSRQELATKTWAELTHPEDLADDLAQFNRVLSGEIDGYSMDKRFINKDGNIVHARISGKCIRKSNGEIDHFVAMLDDVTAHRLRRKKPGVFRRCLFSRPA